MSHTQNKKRPQNSRLMIGGIPLSPLWACWECYQAGASDNGFVHITCSVIYTIRYNKIQYKRHAQWSNVPLWSNRKPLKRFNL